MWDASDIYARLAVPTTEPPSRLTIMTKHY
jgi:hypothetical protein